MFSEMLAMSSGGGTNVPNTAVGKFTTQAQTGDPPVAVTGLGFTPRIVSVALDNNYSRYYLNMDGTTYCMSSSYSGTNPAITVTSDGFTFVPYISAANEFNKEAIWFASA